MADEILKAGDDVFGSGAAGTLHNVLLKDVPGGWGPTQPVINAGPFPEVPGAVSCNITYDGSNQPTTQVYKDAAAATLATKTLTWVAGNCTRIVWS